MSLTILRPLSVSAAVGAILAVSVPASAHIKMVGDVQARSNDDSDQKVKPCQGLKRGAGEVYTFEPGATIKLGVEETIGHDGYFRVAFDNDGEDGFKDPKSIKPINPMRQNQGPTDQDKASDFCNVVSNDGGPTVLFDRLTPHVAGFLEGKEWSWNIKLPNVECDNCTLQVMQVMEDPPGHGPFDGKNDLYYRCIDIVLKKGAGQTKGTATGPLTTEGMQCTTEGQEPPPVTGSDAGVVTATDAGATTTGAAKDAGSTKPAARDAGTPTTEAGSSGDEASDDETDDEEKPATGSVKDAGKGTKKDAGTSSSSSKDEDEDDSAPAKPAAVDDGGCSVAASHTNVSGAIWSLLALSALLVRRKRGRAT
jgi:hypothetical protein